MKSDYYGILGVRRGASSEEVRAAYRRLVRRHHPDLNPDDEASHDRMKEINLAYEVLSDPAAHAAYDRELQAEEERRQASEARRRAVREYYGPEWGYESPYTDDPFDTRSRPRRRTERVEDLFDESFQRPFSYDFSGSLDELFAAIDRLMRSVESLDAEVQEDVARAYRRMRRRRW